MVPEMPTAPYRTDGGNRVETASEPSDVLEVEAPLVPDLS